MESHLNKIFNNIMHGFASRWKWLYGEEKIKLLVVLIVNII